MRENQQGKKRASALNKSSRKSTSKLIIVEDDRQNGIIECEIKTRV